MVGGWRKARCQEQEAVGHIALVVGKQRVNRKWGWVMKPHDPSLGTSSSSKAPPPKSSTSFLNSVTQLRAKCLNT